MITGNLLRDNQQFLMWNEDNNFFDNKQNGDRNNLKFVCAMG